ncbi:MAG: translation initiation factor IF-2 [Leptolyngbyaceae cyanobacterium]
MNSGKVRIYELSKELNLDNRDLLAICEQLNISVKSHSSTITDSEAEQIRAAAKNHIPLSVATTRSRQGHGDSSAESPSKPSISVQKKQQILEIRKPPRQSVPLLEQPVSPAAQPTPTSEPVAPVKVALKLTVPAAVVPSVPVAPIPVAPAAELVQEVAEPDAELTPPADIQPMIVPVIPNLQSPPVLPLEQSVKPEAKPSVPRPAPPPKPTLPIRPVPVLKRQQPEAPPAPTKAPSSTGEKRSPVQAPAKAAPTKPGAGRPSSDRPTPKPQTIVELRRPPSRPVESALDAAHESIETLTQPVLKLKRPQAPSGDEAAAASLNQLPELQLTARPTLPRAKKAKGKQDGEEEVVEFPEKATAKVGPKGKRRKEAELDEDEELEILLEEGEGEDEDAPMQVSLSLVRPAKPKSARSTQPKPTATAPRSRKMSAPRDRRDRREEAKVEKPEKIILIGSLTVQELAAMLMMPETDIIRTLFFKGIAATVTQTLDVETATMVANEFGVEVEAGQQESEAKKITEMLDAADLENLHQRPPVVTIMGHVDHGKTTLLDSIRKTKVAQGEAGGITQHIGAYHVDVPHDGNIEQVVFLDTPGHEAFTAMRARGARVTDIAILVVAADDGVRPQTIEAIRHAQAAEVPIIVAINKVDKEEAQPDRVKQELTEYGLVPEEWGGETIMVPVSALTGDNLDTLLEMILLVSEVEDLHANPDRPAKGTVIEAHLDKAKGPVATLLIQNGTLRIGDVLVAGSVLGKVRAMVDDQGERVKEALPSFAVEVLGLNDVPAAGNEFEVFTDEKVARAVSAARFDEQRQSRLIAAMSSRRVSLNTLSARAQEGELKELNLLLKADVQGSVEAILGSLKQLPQDEVQVRVLYAAPGEISETDVDLAAASDAVIIGFNTTLAPGARQAADRLGVDVRDYNIIYKLLDDIQAAMEGLLEPEQVEESLGQAEVRAVFPVGRGQVAGCYIQSGKVLRNSKIRVRRGGEVIYEGNLDSLKRMKEDAREVNAGYECGIGVDSFNSWQEGDVIESYRMVAKRRTLASKQA